MDQSIIPECYVDTNLIETIVPPKKHYNHQKGCGTVAKVMKEKFADLFALGIIDKDKYQLDYLIEFSEIINLNSLVLHKHASRHHYIIQINPAIERFILNNADEVGVSLEDFGLPSDFDRLKKASKTVNSKNDPRFKRLFKTLLKHNAKDVLKLSLWITYLKGHNYTADIEAVKAL